MLWTQLCSQSAKRKERLNNMKAQLSVTNEPAWLPPRKSAKLIPPKLDEPKKKIPNYAAMFKSFKKFCDDSGYIVQ